MPFQDLRIQPQQTLAASPRLQQAVRLLQMSALDYALELRQSIQDNPFLEMDEPEPEAGPAKEDEAPGEAAAEADDLSVDYDSWLDGSGPRAGPERDDGFDLMDLQAARRTLAGHLHSQLRLLKLPGRDLLLAEAIVDSLDDDGYLRVEPAGLDDVLALDEPASADEWRIAVCRVQSLEPAGVGARSVAECLRLQLGPLGLRDEEARVTAALVELPLAHLSRRNAGQLAQDIGCRPEHVEAGMRHLRQLDPRPGWRFGDPAVLGVAPDVSVRRHRGDWRVRLNDSLVPNVRLHRVYAEILDRQRRGQNPEMASQLRDARWTLRNIEQRFATILGVAQAIVARQTAFFEHGPLALKPLTLAEIAADVGVHESTVSRVTNNKFMATPWGLIEFKKFFSRGMAARSGGLFTGASVRAEIERMLAAEPASKPLSDSQIHQALVRQGLEVTRRTVTKYRNLLRIGSVKERRGAAARSAGPVGIRVAFEGS